MSEAEADEANSVNALVNQIAYADVVLLNKIDLVTAAEINRVEGAVRSINSVARVGHTRLDTDDTPQWLCRVRLSHPHSAAARFHWRALFLLSRADMNRQSAAAPLLLA